LQFQPVTRTLPPRVLPMPSRFLLGVSLLVLGVLTARTPAATATFPIDDLRVGMVATGRTVFEGERLDEFRAHILGVLRNVIGTKRNLILARLEGGPLATTGVIAGMSGSPVYIDGRLVGAVSYSLGQFSKEPIAGITPIAEMIEASNLPDARRQAGRIDIPMPITPEGLQRSLVEAFAWARPFASAPADIQVVGGALNPAMGTMLRPIATPLTMSGFDPRVVDSLTAMFAGQGVTPVVASSLQGAASPAASTPLRPGDPVGVTLMSGDMELGATGTVTEVDGDRVYAFGHPFYGLGPVRFPMTRAYVHTLLPSLASSSKIASQGEVIGTILQDRAVAIAGTLGPGPRLVPIRLTLTSARGVTQRFSMQMVNDQLFTPLLAYLSVFNTLGSYERQNGVGSYAVKGSVTVGRHGTLDFDDLFSGDSASTMAAGSVIGPINALLRNAFEDVDLTDVSLDISASEEPRSATIERVWIDTSRPRAGGRVTLRMLLRTFRGEEFTRTQAIEIPATARGSVQVMVSDAPRLAQWEARELPLQPLQARGLPQMLKALNAARRNNRVYVRLLGRDGGALVKGEPLSALPPSVLAVLEADRNSGTFRALDSVVLGEWEVPAEVAVTGTRTLTLTLDN
jgi:SpoIVB peptidase S55